MIMCTDLRKGKDGSRCTSVYPSILAEGEINEQFETLHYSKISVLKQGVVHSNPLTIAVTQFLHIL
jgi:hypothetical protein